MTTATAAPPVTATVPHRVTVAIALVSAAVLSFEIVLLRLFSFRIWHHFAFMVISVALLGFAAAGLALQLRPAWGRPATARAAAAAALFALAAPFATLVVTRLPFDPSRLGAQPAHLLLLGVFCIVLIPPFALAGFAVLALLAGHPKGAGRLYGADLWGAGAGALLVAPLLAQAGALGIVALSAAAALGAAALLAAEPERRTLSRAAIAGALVLVALAFTAGPRLDVPPGPGKLMGAHLLDTAKFPNARVTWTGWSALARVDVIENSARMEWTGNAKRPTSRPPETSIVIDGDATAPVVHWDGKDQAALGFLDHTLSSAVPRAFKPQRALVIGAGGGVDVLCAVHHGVPHVDAVEVNPAIAALGKGLLAPVNGGLFLRPDVNLVVAEGRSYVRRSTATYDMVQLSLIDTWAAGAAGAYSLSEGYLYTVEAFRDYLARLSPGGVLTITRWEWSPPRELIRVCSVARAALAAEGVARPGDQIIVLASGNLGNVIVKRTPFTSAELESVRRVAQESGFDVIHAPGLPPNNPFGMLLAGSDPEGFVRDYRFDIAPTTDDSPFFFQFGRWRDVDLFGAGWKESQLVLSGRLVICAVLLQVLVLSALLLGLPLFAARSGAGASNPESRARAGAAAAYFGIVGLSFMLLEVALMQRFTLFLGSPVLAISVVLAVLLVAAGTGSRLSEKLAARGGSHWPIFIAVAVVAAFAAFALPAVFRATLGLPDAGRIALAAVLLAPMGIALGMPFPTGLARLAGSGADGDSGGGLFGLAWAANGVGSVVGPALAVLLAIDVGFTTVLLLGALGYVAAGAFVRKLA